MKINKISGNAINKDFTSNKEGNNNYTYHNQNNSLNKSEKTRFDPLKISNIRNNKTNIKTIRTFNVSGIKKSKFFTSQDKKIVNIY